MTRPQGEPSLLTGAVLRAVLVIAAFAALLHFTDRLIAGWVQCEAAQSCPHGDTQ